MWSYLEERKDEGMVRTGCGRGEWDRENGEMKLTSRWADRGIYGYCMKSGGADPRR